MKHISEIPMEVIEKFKDLKSPKPVEVDDASLRARAEELHDCPNYSQEGFEFWDCVQKKIFNLKTRTCRLCECAYEGAAKSFENKFLKFVPEKHKTKDGSLNAEVFKRKIKIGEGSVWLHGESGAGKSFTVFKRGLRLVNSGKTNYGIFKGRDLQNFLYEKYQDFEVFKRFKKLYKKDFLIFDDITKIELTDTRQSELFDIIKTCLEANVIMLFTSNSRMEEFCGSFSGNYKAPLFRIMKEIVDEVNC